MPLTFNADREETITRELRRRARRAVAESQLTRKLLRAARERLEQSRQHLRDIHALP
jgi:hypothetical protein